MPCILLQLHNPAFYSAEQETCLQVSVLETFVHDPIVDWSSTSSVERSEGGNVQAQDALQTLQGARLLLLVSLLASATPKVCAVRFSVHLAPCNHSCVRHPMLRVASSPVYLLKGWLLSLMSSICCCRARRSATRCMQGA